MATFVKLTNGDIINIQQIKLIKRHEHMGAGALARYFNESRQEEGSKEGNRVETVPSIEMQLGSDSNPLLLKYKSEQERDAEFERIEAILLPKQEVLFTNLLLNPALIQSMQVGWIGHMDTTLEIRITATNTSTYVVQVTPDDEADWKQAHELISQFGLTVPKTMQERMEVLRAKNYDENGNRKPGYYGVL